MSDRVFSDPYEDPERVRRALAHAAAILTAGWDDTESEDE